MSRIDVYDPDEGGVLASTRVEGSTGPPHRVGIVNLPRVLLDEFPDEPRIRLARRYAWKLAEMLEDGE